MNRRRFLQQTLPGAAGAAAGLRLASASSQTAARNVLFIAVDDLRPELGCYGNPYVRTPNIDRLAASGVVFQRAYCQMAVCNPSRTSLLTGLRPDSTQVFNLRDHFRGHVPDVITLPQHFKQHGYFTQSFGKVFHNELDDPLSWSGPTWPDGRMRGMEYVDERKLQELRRQRPDLALQGPEFPRITWKKHDSWQAPDVPDDALQDGEAAERALRAMRRLRGRRFFLAVGFLKPHMPFVAPKNYFDLYSKRDIGRIPQPFPVRGAPAAAVHAWEELRGYRDIPKEGPLSGEKALELVRAYYAATSYMDAQVGRLLEGLDRLGLAGNTVVVLWGDHGYHLGEQDLWCKATNFELDTRSPLIVRTPDGAARGRAISALVEFVDIYPALCDACGLPVPDGLEGSSFAPLLANPSRPWKKAAFSQFCRPWLGRSKWETMGHSIRTEEHRYTAWRDRAGSLVAEELYDYAQSAIETENLAGRPEHSGLAARLRESLAAGWRGALPEASGA